MKSKLTLLGVALAVALTAVAAEKKLWANSFLGKKAPKLETEKWLTPIPNMKDKLVLIDFWATWCGPCLKAIPELNAIHKKFGDKIVVVGLSDETEAEVRKLKSPKIEYALALDSKERMKKAVGVTGIPHVIIMDADWVVRWEGFPLLKDHELTEKVVEDLIAKHGK